MEIITIATDFGYSGTAAAELAGVLLQHFPTHKIIEVTHEAIHGNTVQLVALVRRLYRYFPAGTVHLLAADEGHSLPHKGLLITHWQNQFWIAPDNGTLFLLTENSSQPVFWATPTGNQDPWLYAKTIQDLYKDRQLTNFQQHPNPMVSLWPYPTTTRDSINGTILYADKQSNFITNISRETWESVGKNRPATFFIRATKEKILPKSLFETPEGSIHVGFGTNDLLRVCIRNGEAFKLLSAGVDDLFSIEFEPTAPAFLEAHAHKIAPPAAMEKPLRTSKEHYEVIGQLKNTDKVIS